MASGKSIYLLLIFVVALLFGLTNYSVVTDMLFEASNYPEAETPNAKPEHVSVLQPSRASPPLKQTEANNGEDLELEYILECQNEIYTDDPSYHHKALSYLSSLADSQLQDKRAEYALYAPLAQGQSRLSLLFDYIETFPTNSLILMEAMNLCARSDNPKCNKGFMTAGLKSDYENGAMWLIAANFYASRQEDQLVFESIAGLEKAAIYNERFGERILRFIKALESSQAHSFFDNSIGGIGREAARATGDGYISKWCNEGLGDVNKAAACLTLGKNLEQRSKNTLTQHFGMVLQRMVYESESNLALLSELQARAELSVKTYSQQFVKATELMLRHEAHFRDWLKNLDELGEADAAKLLIKEAIAFSKIENIDHCQPQ